MEQRIVIPLDGVSKTKALEIAARLKGHVWGFKVNDLLVAHGVSIVTELKQFGGVFADPKLYDIPNTVLNSTKALADAGADLITVHASGGREMIKSAVKGAGSAKILAVTILTSYDEPSAKEVFGRDINSLVRSFALLAAESGAHGIVSSPQELELLSKESQLASLMKVTPGVRPSWYVTKDDQVRVLTPREAVELGADLLVIGRPITGHDDPVVAARMVQDEIC